MPNYTSRGRVRITVTELGRGRVPLATLAVAATGAAVAGDHYARTIGEAITITVDAAFAVTLAVIVTMIMLIAGRIHRAVNRATTSASAAITSATVTTSATPAEVASRGPAPLALPARPVITIRPEWSANRHQAGKRAR